MVNEDRPADLSHLPPAAQQIARLPDAERLRYIRADRWIGYPRATTALERLETLLAWPSKQRMPNLLLIGPANNGPDPGRCTGPARYAPPTRGAGGPWSGGCR